MGHITQYNISHKISKSLFNPKSTKPIINISSNLKFHHQNHILQNKINPYQLKSTDNQGIDKITTPHYGYHYDNINTEFFEGWYFKVHKFN